MVTRESVKHGDYFRLPMSNGYNKSSHDTAMQVMECWSSVMTVKSDNGCLTMEYNQFEKIDDLSSCTKVYKSDYFEDNR